QARERRRAPQGRSFQASRACGDAAGSRSKRDPADFSTDRQPEAAVFAAGAFAVMSCLTHWSAAPETGCVIPGNVTQPPFLMKALRSHSSVFFREANCALAL